MRPLVVLLSIHAPADFDVGAMIATAQRVYAPAEISLIASSTRSPSDLEIDSVGDRNLLRDEVDDATIHVFVVDRLADKKRADLAIGGVHWYHRGRRYFIVSRVDGRHDTFAHELGHYFGLRHTVDRSNIMAPPDRVRDARLTPDQQRRARRGASSRAVN